MRNSELGNFPSTVSTTQSSEHISRGEWRGAELLNTDTRKHTLSWTDNNTEPGVSEGAAHLHRRKRDVLPHLHTVEECVALCILRPL